MRAQALRRVCSGVHLNGFGYDGGLLTVEGIKKAMNAGNNPYADPLASAIAIIGTDQHRARRVLSGLKKATRGQLRAKRIGRWSRSASLYQITQRGY